MSNRVFKIYGSARFKTRSDTLENWQAKNPVLLSGEPSFVTDASETDKIKIGDGKTPWNDLDYWRGPSGYTPQKGVDYYTPKEKAEFIEEIENNLTGDIETALDSIIAIQDALIGGASV